MTVANLKRLDKYIRQIQDPFGTGFLILKRMIAETTEKYGLSASQLIQKYVAWKWVK